MGSRVLFLDDSPERTAKLRSHLPWADCTETAAGMIALLAAKDERPVAALFLDHDLGDEVYVHSDRTDCGMEVVRWMVAHRPAVERVFVHTLNEPAAREMVVRLREAGYSVERAPFIFIKWDAVESYLGASPAGEQEE